MTVGNEAELVMVVRRKLSYETPEQLSEVLDNLTNRTMRDRVDAIGTFLYQNDKEPQSGDFESVKFYAVLDGNGNK
jgi:hypothetical protein